MSGSAIDLGKSMLKAGSLYLWEMVRCCVAGLVLSLLAFAVVAKGGAGAGWPLAAAALVFLIAFPVAYFVVAQQRALDRVLGTLADAHGERFYDATFGRFVDTLQVQQPGALASLLAQPKALTARFQGFLERSERMPRLARRVALHFAGKIIAAIPFAGLAAQEAPAAIRAAAVTTLQDRFEASWQTFLIVAAGQAAVAAAACWWLSR
ncbi:hypothetical protein P3W85_19765 [Cupriavidus basilensis]|uniref:Uncharacterized protein n=1 Tax=Cupriavidus basilensis TaxID=68895 RepID=A0ABT6ASF2_9BURK|nr:hypothetical protein [Cupriavidus basilensis]MDF3835182.1 hypothetical protein [Cupriavidus basilensis]